MLCELGSYILTPQNPDNWRPQAPNRELNNCKRPARGTDPPVRGTDGPFNCRKCRKCLNCNGSSCSFNCRGSRGSPKRLKTILTTPTPILTKNMPSKSAIKWGVVWRKKSLEIKPLSQRISCTNPDFYGIQTPTFMAYEPRLLCHMSRSYWGWGWSSTYWAMAKI